MDSQPAQLQANSFFRTALMMRKISPYMRKNIRLLSSMIMAFTTEVSSTSAANIIAIMPNEISPFSHFLSPESFFIKPKRPTATVRYTVPAANAARTAAKMISHIVIVFSSLFHYTIIILENIHGVNCINVNTGAFICEFSPKPLTAVGKSCIISVEYWLR